LAKDKTKEVKVARGIKCGWVARCKVV